MTEFLDLFGELRSKAPGSKGRPDHVPSDENRYKIMVLLCSDRTQKQIADALGLSVPTLRKHYFSILVKPEKARVAEFATRMAALWQQGIDGNVSAFKEYDAKMKAELMRGQSEKIRAAAEKSGSGYVKKSDADLASAQAAQEHSGWGSLVPEMDQLQ